MLRYLKNQEIDRQRWDKCIENSINKLIYAYSWFLDTVSPGWEAIIKDDYSIVMPLPVKSKFGFKYIVQPLLAKQLGVFSLYHIDDSILKELFDIMIKKFKYIRLNLNHNSITKNPLFINQYKNNHELNLKSTYDVIRKGYKRRAFQNIRRANKHNLLCHEETKISDFLKFAKQNVAYLNNKEYNRYIGLLAKLINEAANHINIEIYTVINTNNQIVATGLFLNNSSRIYFIFNVSNKVGISSQSMYFLTDYVIKKYAGSNYILDFTGSNIEGIAYFIESFGAYPNIYQYIQYKNYRFPLKYLIK